MSFATIAQCADDVPFQRRLTGAYASEGAPNPEGAMWGRRWTIAADPSIAPPFESAVIAGNPNPGGDPSVITDGMLLAAVAAHPPL
jgi:hypothetical protein